MIMKTQLTCLFLLIAVACTTAQRRTVDVDNFSKLSFGIPGTLYLTQGSEEKVEVECSDDIFDGLEFDMDGSKLKIRNKDAK